jgi:hypothetical protein
LKINQRQVFCLALIYLIPLLAQSNCSEYNPNLDLSVPEVSVQKVLAILSIVLLANILLTACSASSKTDAPAKAVEDYLNALVAKDADRLPTLVCGDWESDALVELDSFQAVTTRLEDVSCKAAGTDGKFTLVNCKGNIVATYNNEDQKLDLSTRTYQVTQENGDWLVCGTR